MYDHTVLFCPHSEVSRRNNTTTEIDGEHVSIRFCNMCEHTLYGQHKRIRVKDANTGVTYHVEFRDKEAA